MGFHRPFYYTDTGSLFDYGSKEKDMDLSEYHRSVSYLRIGEEKPLPGKPLYNSDQKPDYHGRWENTGVDDDGVYQPIDRTKPSLEGSREKEREAKAEKKRQSENTAISWNGKSEWMNFFDTREEDTATGSSLLDWAKDHLQKRAEGNGR